MAHNTDSAAPTGGEEGIEQVDAAEQRRRRMRDRDGAFYVPMHSRAALAARTSARLAGRG